MTVVSVPNSLDREGTRREAARGSPGPTGTAAERRGENLKGLTDLGSGEGHKASRCQRVAHLESYLTKHTTFTKIEDFCLQNGSSKGHSLALNVLSVPSRREAARESPGPPGTATERRGEGLKDFFHHILIYLVIHDSVLSMFCSRGTPPASVWSLDA